MGNKARKVIQVDKTGKDLREFSSAKEAALYCGYPNGSSAISKAIRHGSCAFSFRWRYKDEPLYIKESGTPGKRRRIVAINSNNEERLFLSISEASRELGIGISSIESSLLMGCYAKGYRFRYEGEAIEKSYKRERNRKEVVAIDNEGNVIASYPSAYVCAESLGVIPAAVYRCLNSNNPNAKCKGYRLRYKE